MGVDRRVIEVGDDGEHRHTSGGGERRRSVERVEQHREQPGVGMVASVLEDHVDQLVGVLQRLARKNSGAALGLGTEHVEHEGNEPDVLVTVREGEVGVEHLGAVTHLRDRGDAEAEGGRCGPAGTLEQGGDVLAELVDRRERTGRQRHVGGLLAAVRRRHRAHDEAQL